MSTHDAPPGLDLARVTAWLHATRPELLPGPVRARLVAGGRSNLTYVLEGGPEPVVLRRPPLGHVQATAHDMAREHRMISALAGTGVPVPTALALCEDPAVLGAPFYLMTFVEGLVVRGPADLVEVDAAGRARLAAAMVDVLADLHAVDPVQVGLSGFGRPEGFMARQVRRWATQLDGSRSRDLPGVERLRDALADTVPAPTTRAGGCIVHGDYRLDNLVVAAANAPRPLHVRAVLDWEMATIGDPLADLGLLLAYWDGLGALPDSAVASLGPASGFPPGSVLLQRYGERSGTPVPAIGWYVAFGYFKIAVILEGIHYRFVHGQTLGAGFERIGELVPTLVDLGLRELSAGR